MSSFIGHGLAAFAIGKGFSSKAQFGHGNIWQVFLLFCAIAPDIDYLIADLNRLHNDGLRVTHSIAFSLILPVLGIIYLYAFDRKNIYWGGLQAILAGLSHLVLDTLVGTKDEDPLLFPLMTKTFNLPFGILPSAGQISLSNYYFYRNTLIECGILVPAIILIFHFTGVTKIRKIGIVFSIVSFIIFLTWSIGLAR